jgi:hypothetical protein
LINRQATLIAEQDCLGEGVLNKSRESNVEERHVLSVNRLGTGRAATA